MHYGDEGIVKLLNAYKKQIQGNIYEGFSVCEDLYRFSKKEVIPEFYKLYLPIRFKDITEGNIFNIQKMDKIYANKKQTIQLKFKRIETKVTKQESEEFLRVICEQITCLNPSIEILENGEAENNIRWIDYKITYGKSNGYVMLFCIWKNEQMLYGEFTCAYHEAVYWKYIFLSMIKTGELLEG